MTDCLSAPSPDRSGPTTATPMLTRLGAMMFLQYFIQGCYLPVISEYLKSGLGFTLEAVGYFAGAIAIGPLAAPFLVGQIIDRHFPTERVLALSHLAAALVMLVLFGQSSFWPVIVLGTLYSVLYVPTMMLTNTLAFHHLADRAREFPRVRMLGTIGFVVPAWAIESFWLKGLSGGELNQQRGIILAAAGMAGLVMGLYSLTLPATPPPQRKGAALPPAKSARSWGRFAPGLVLAQLRFPDFAVLVAVSFGVAIVHQFFFTVNSPFLHEMLLRGGIREAWEQRISSIGQIAEIGVMAVLGAVVARLGFRWTMMLGISAYLLRCLVFAGAIHIGQPYGLVLGAVCAGQALHGLCFGCFLAVAFMYVDQVSPGDIRGSMQTIYGTFVLGLGFFTGGIVSGQIAERFTHRTASAVTSDWTAIWLSSAAMAAVCLLVMGLAFRPRPSTA